MYTAFIEEIVSYLVLRSTVQHFSFNDAKKLTKKNKLLWNTGFLLEKLVMSLKTFNLELETQRLSL